MRTSQCAVYQVKETPEYRDVRFRSYEKLRSEGKSVSIENYQRVYIGRIQLGGGKKNSGGYKNVPAETTTEELQRSFHRINKT